MKEKRFDPQKDYPVGSRRPDLVGTLSGKKLSDITLERVASGRIGPQDIRIGPEVLELQAQVAEAHGRVQMAANFRRAAELTGVPDEEILRIYHALRPRRSTKVELLEIAKQLEERYQSPINADFVREAVENYETRDLLKKR